ncbi:response regulator [Arenibacter sp. GZD96]|uniref:response regulator n=1 Tax=Aurantibrevibacter litoralis TaxID=3106030 RepID=UPI002AFFF216|nr:response regulator [Arenibacter sp. GZD-96]MEA1786136.1 response regulator [Arenibacter sp. GZD-96]
MIIAEKVRILVVEDDMIIAAHISLQLTKLGYEVTGIVTRGEEAILHAKENTPDILLMDVNLKGKLDGIGTAALIQKNNDVPIVYLTANSDEATFSRAKTTHPYAFLSKPLNTVQLQRTVALVVEQLKEKEGTLEKCTEPIEILEDRIFVRHNKKMTRLLLKDILYIEANRNYCNIVTASNHYLLTTTLKTIEEKIAQPQFLRVHRSYIVNISKLDAVGDSHLEINRKVIPFGKAYRDLLMRRLQTI